jgi:hypothetical protein
VIKIVVCLIHLDCYSLNTLGKCSGRLRLGFRIGDMVPGFRVGEQLPWLVGCWPGVVGCRQDEHLGGGGRRLGRLAAGEA